MAETNLENGDDCLIPNLIIHKHTHTHTHPYTSSTSNVQSRESIIYEQRGKQPDEVNCQFSFSKSERREFKYE